jgi:hypothetical protein
VPKVVATESHGALRATDLDTLRIVALRQDVHSIDAVCFAFRGDQNYGFAPNPLDPAAGLKGKQIEIYL